MEPAPEKVCRILFHETGASGKFTSCCSESFRLGMIDKARWLGISLEIFWDVDACAAAGGETPDAKKVFKHLCSLLG